MHIINVGSKSPAKVEAVRETLQDYDFLKPFELRPFEVASGISEQPLDIEEISLGSRNRALNVFSDCNYGIGLESGLVKFPYSDSYLDLCVCSVFDGVDFYQGYSEAFEVPRNIVRLILEKGLDLSQATKEVGLTNEEKVGANKGIINILTRGRFVRGSQIRSSLQMALTAIENPHFYKNGLDGI